MLFRSQNKSELRVLEKANDVFADKHLGALMDRVVNQRDDVNLSEQILGSIDKGNFGPGEKIDQALSEALQVVGGKKMLNPDEQKKYLNNLNIQQAKDLMATKALRSNLGAQFTQQENQQFKALLPDIGSPKEMIKAYYQLRIANAKADQAELSYLKKHPTKIGRAHV